MVKRGKGRARKLATVPMVKQMIQGAQETKLVELTNSTTASTTVASVHLTAVSQGTDQNERIGNLLTCTGLYIKGYATLADATNLVRLVLYIPKTPTASLTGLTVSSLVDLDEHTVLYDKLLMLGAAREQVPFSIRKSFHRGMRKGIRLEYDGTGTVPTRNAIKLALVSDSVAVSHPGIDYAGRIYYKDA